jgi:hypothetical protein
VGRGKKHTNDTTSGPVDTNVNVNSLKSLAMVHLDFLIIEERNEMMIDIGKTLVDVVQNQDAILSLLFPCHLYDFGDYRQRRKNYYLP